MIKKIKTTEEQEVCNFASKIGAIITLVLVLVFGAVACCVLKIYLQVQGVFVLLTSSLGVGFVMTMTLFFMLNILLNKKTL